MDKMLQDLSEAIDEITLAVTNIIELLAADDEFASMGDKSFHHFLHLSLDKLYNCQVALRRDYFKCVFVGRTSNGKSTVINALLRQSIFPMGIGHTTNCFVTLRTKDIDDAYIEHFQQSDLTTPVAVYSMDKIKNLTHALSPEKVNSNDTIRVNYPTKSTSLFGTNVFLVDSPGLDIDGDFDEWIDKHCLDADIFVLVTNAESVLMRCERRFFVRVKERFSTPNILIVNNRWDSSSDQGIEESNKVKNQQMKMFSDFLVTELNVCLENQISKRIFFVSALEELRDRSNLDNLNNIEGRFERCEEFKRFEKVLKENLSEKAFKNKITSNFKVLERTFEELNCFVNCIFNTIIIEKEFVKKSMTARTKLLKNVESDIVRIHQKAANYIEHIVMKAREKISNDFQNLVCNLDTAIDTIKLSFDPFNRKDYLAYQRLVVENIENSVFQDLKMRTMTCVNGQLKTGVERLTKIYTELVLSNPPQSPLSHGLDIACQSPLHTLYPDFSKIMNRKIKEFKSQITPIPLHVLSLDMCTKYFNAVDNRFNTCSDTHVDNIAATGASVAPHSFSRLPEVTLMIPKFSAVILADFSFIPGFRFSLSPASIRLIASQWNMSHCPIRRKIRTITWNSVIFVCSFGVVSYLVIHFNGKFWKHGIGVVVGIYGFMYLSEKRSWDTKREMKSLRSQFVTHCKHRMESIIHISAVTTARQLGSFLHLDLKGLQTAGDGIIRDLHQQVDDIIFLESKVLANEKKFKKLKSNFYIISHQIVTFKKEIVSSDL